MNIHHYIHYDQHDEHTIIKLLKKILMEQSELAAQLTALATQLDKAKNELNQKITELGDAIEAADDVSPEVLAAFEAVKTAAQGVDDIVPDAPPPPPIEG